MIDVDGHNFPNLPLMKLSAWHKLHNDSVEWYNSLFHSVGEPFDKVYMSKVFSFTSDYPYYVNAKEVKKSGSGYCISLENGKEIYHKENDTQLSYEIEHIYPDYSLYPELTNDTAYGFLSRGCPRGCVFCHVEAKEGRKAYKVADLSEFWRGQKNIVLLDPNLLACREWKNILQQLIDCKSWVDFSQGVDIRLMTKEKAEMIKQIKTKNIHFAWDRYEDRDIIIPKFKEFKQITKWDKRKLTVYVLTNFDTTIEQDLARIYILRNLGYWPYVMIYNKDDYVDCDKNGKPIKLKSLDALLKRYTLNQIQHFEVCWKIQRWVNGRAVFESVKKFEDYKEKQG